MHALRRAAFAAPRQLPLRAAPRAQSWQPVARLFSSENLAAAEQTPSATASPGSSKTSSSESQTAGANSESQADESLTPAEKARLNKAVGKTLSSYEKKANLKPQPARSSPATSKAAPPPKPAAKPAAVSTAPESGAAPWINRPKDFKPPTDIPDVDWSTSYHGAGYGCLSPGQYKALNTPISVEDVEVKPDGVIYLPEIKYRRKLNQVFGPMGWALIPRSDPVVGQSIVTREYILVAEGRFVAQAQGENNYFNADQLPSAVEGCKSNALMRCCKDLGIASELWDPIFVRSFRKEHMTEAWVEHAVTKKKRTLWFKKGAVEYVYPWQKSGAAKS